MWTNHQSWRKNRLSMWTSHPLWSTFRPCPWLSQSCRRLLYSKQTSRLCPSLFLLSFPVLYRHPLWTSHPCSALCHRLLCPCSGLTRLWLFLHSA